MRTVEQDHGSRELGLLPSVQEALGELVNAANEGLLALSVRVAERDRPRRQDPLRRAWASDNHRLAAAARDDAILLTCDDRNSPGW